MDIVGHEMPRPFATGASWVRKTNIPDGNKITRSGYRAVDAASRCPNGRIGQEWMACGARRWPQGRKREVWGGILELSVQSWTARRLRGT